MQNELADDADYYRGSGLLFPLDPACADIQPHPLLLRMLKAHLERLDRYYTRLYSRTNTLRDSVVRSMQGTTAQEHAAFRKLKEENHNTALTKLLRTLDETENISVYNGHLIQRNDPIFQYPRSTNLKAHFYAPYKRLGNVYIATYWFNLVVLISSILIQWCLLYFRLLKRLINRIEGLF